MNTQPKLLFVFVWLAAVALLQWPQSAYADAAPKWTDAQLVGFADVILRGRVTGLGVALDERVGTPYTHVAVDVSEVLKGALPDRRVTIKQLGGRVGGRGVVFALAALREREQGGVEQEFAFHGRGIGYDGSGLHGTRNGRYTRWWGEPRQ